MSQSSSAASTTFALPRESLAGGVHHGAAALSKGELASLLFEGVRRVTDAVQAQGVKAPLQPFTRANALAAVVEQWRDRMTVASLPQDAANFSLTSADAAAALAARPSWEAACARDAVPGKVAQDFRKRVASLVDADKSELSGKLLATVARHRTLQVQRTWRGVVAWSQRPHEQRRQVGMDALETYLCGWMYDQPGEWVSAPGAAGGAVPGSPVPVAKDYFLQHPVDSN